MYNPHRYVDDDICVYSRLLLLVSQSFALLQFNMASLCRDDYHVGLTTEVSRTSLKSFNVLVYAYLSDSTE